MKIVAFLKPILTSAPKFTNSWPRNPPQDTWQVETTSCFRFCPERKISYSLVEPDVFPRGQMAMSTFNSAEEFPQHFTEEILRRKSYAPKS